MTTEQPPRRAVRPQVWVLVALLAGVAAVLYYQSQRAGTPTETTPGTRRAGRGSDAQGEAPAALKLVALDEERPEPVGASRNPFRFQPKAPPAPPAPIVPAPRPIVPAAGSTGEPGSAVQPAPPPIPLKFIGTIEAPGVGKVAALSDGKFVYRGREGDVIEGRYRIVKIGVESIVIEYLDGRGRQTIRLTG